MLNYKALDVLFYDIETLTRFSYKLLFLSWRCWWRRFHKVFFIHEHCWGYKLSGCGTKV